MLAELIAEGQRYTQAALDSPTEMLAVASVIVAGGLVLVSSFVKTMIPLRWLVVGSNVGLFIYGALHPSLTTMVVAAALMFVGYKLATFRGLPNVVVILSILTVLYAFFTENTTTGRRIYALGGNEKAAKLSGIKTDRLVFLTFCNMGVLAALAGMIVAARLNSSTPKAGVGFELDVIAAVFIGGASMSGGVGKIIGVVVGALIMGVMNNGMSILGIGIDYQQVIKGLVLLAAVIFDVYNKNK